jgi:hypothetical protein
MMSGAHQLRTSVVCQLSLVSLHQLGQTAATGRQLSQLNLHLGQAEPEGRAAALALATEMWLAHDLWFYQF